MDKINIGNRLRELREERDLSQGMVVKDVNEKIVTCKFLPNKKRAYHRSKSTVGSL